MGPGLGQSAAWRGGRATARPAQRLRRRLLPARHRDLRLCPNFSDNGNQNSGLLQFYLPFNRRFEFRIDIPVAVSNRRATGDHYETNFGDFTIVPRFIVLAGLMKVF